MTNKNTRPTISRRSAIAALPLGTVGLVAVAKGSQTTSKGILDERALRNALERFTEASTSGYACAFTAFAQHVAALASAGDCQSVRAVAERLTDHLYTQHNHYGETRGTWLTEERGSFAEYVDMDDESLPDALRDAATERSNARHERRTA